MQTSLLYFPELRMLTKGVQVSSVAELASQLASHSLPSRPHFLENFPFFQVCLNLAGQSVSWGGSR